MSSTPGIITHEIEVNKTRSEILEQTLEKIKQYKSSLYYLGPIDYSEFYIKSGHIEIIRTPSTLFAYRPIGTIIIEINDNDAGRSKLVCSISVFKKVTLIPMLIFLGALFLLFFSTWIIIFMIFNWNAIGLLIFSFGFIMFSIFILADYFIAKKRLLNYSRKVIKEITI